MKYLVYLIIKKVVFEDTDGVYQSVVHPFDEKNDPILYKEALWNSQRERVSLADFIEKKSEGKRVESM